MEFKQLSDLGLVAVYVALGYSPHERIKKGKKVYFVFEWDDEMQRIKDDYFDYRMVDVDARKLNMTVKSLKYSIYNAEDYKVVEED